MWIHIIEPLEDYDGYKLTIQTHGRRLSRGECLDLLATEHLFRVYLTNVLKDLPLQAFRWETPPISDKSLRNGFECVVLDAPELEAPADVHTFSEYFRSMEAGGVAEFPNMSGDAQLIVPSPVDQYSNYNHLASFLRSAPESQVDALWETAGRVARHNTSSRPRWLNTAGAGVAWLHIRLDQQPKYYVYNPYCDVNA